MPGGKPGHDPRRQDREIRKLKGELIRDSKNFTDMVKKYQKELEDVSFVSSDCCRVNIPFPPLPSSLRPSPSSPRTLTSP